MHRSNFLIVLLGLLLVGGGVTLEARAQAVYGSISGSVVDSTGAAVSKATVTITSIDRHTSTSVTTNDSGLYTKERLLPGTYEVKVEAPSFKQSIFPSV